MPRVIFKSKSPTPLNYQAMRQQLLAGLKRGGDEIRDNFERTTETWKTKPDFEPRSTEPVESNHHAIVKTITTDDVYGYVDRGTLPHMIYPKNAKRLRFEGTFSAKTVPGVIASVPGFSGPPIIYSDGVAHPGIRPRDFEKTIFEIAKVNLPNYLKDAVSKAQNISTHRK